MKELRKENYIDYVNQSKKKIEYTDVSFTEYQPDDDFTYSVRQLFYRDDSNFAQDFVYRQNLLFDKSVSYLFFQIPLADRVYGLVKGSVKISVGSYVVIDDGNGNLFEQSDVDKIVQIGNIFYSSGCIFITSHQDFEGTSDNIQTYFKGNTININFKKYVNIREKFFIIDVSDKDFSSTTNGTWSLNNPLFFNKIYLYNKNHDLVAVGNISKNIPLKNKITIMLESFEVY